MAKKWTVVECFKCSGRGTIQAFSAVAGGVCFSCGGAGRKLVAGSGLRASKWACVFGGSTLFYVRAKSASAAMAKAVGHWEQHRNAPAMAAVSRDQIAVAESP